MFKTHIAMSISAVLICMGLSWPETAHSTDQNKVTNAKLGTATMREKLINASERRTVIKEISETMLLNYVFEDIALKIANDLKARLDRGEYDALNDVGEFAKRLTKDLREASHDQHIEVIFSIEKNDPVPIEEETISKKEKARSSARVDNFGIQKYELLDGNIGLLQFNAFISRELGEQIVASAMTLASSADALIIDLRTSRGGDPHMVELVSSYLFDNEKIHLNDLYFRRINLTQEYWTDPNVPGLRLGSGKPVYVLTSAQTFSAAEEFTYNLQSLKRATIVGETTRGGAHLGNSFRLSDQLVMFTPIARAINPVTKTNWERVGVKPDVAVTAARALNTAKILAMESVMRQISDIARKNDLQKKIDALKAEM
jgi:hypothetical protein